MPYPMELYNECKRLYKKYDLGNETPDKWINDMWCDKAMLFPFIELVITTKCNLKCKYCSNLIPYYDKSYVEDIKDIIKWIDLLSNKAKYIFRLKLHGGEPLTHPDIAEIISYACSKDNVLDVRLSTNGTIVPSNVVLEAMANPKFHLHISDYEKTCGINTSKIELLCQKYNIDFFKMIDEPWQNLGGVQLRTRTKEAKKKLIKQCNMSGCRSFQKGILYVCSRAGHGERQGLFGHNYYDCLDFVNGVDFDGYLRFFENYDFISCDYCDGAVKGRNEIHAGEQLI